MSFFRKKDNKMSNRPLPVPGGAPPNAHANRTRGAFGEKPEEGWHHDQRAMGVGLGVYFSYPVIYVGRIELPQSISSMDHDAQTEITREAIARCVDESFPRTPGRRHLSQAAQRYRFGYSDAMMFDVKLSMSARGIIIAPLDDPDGIVGFYPMRNISLATGGENIDYDYVSFTARDKETGQRHSHVFDCGLHSDDVMTDLGQAFLLAQELQAKGGSNQSQNSNSYLDVVPDGLNEALAPPPGADALYADLHALQPVSNPMYGMNAGGTQLYDAASAGQGYFDVKPEPPQVPPEDESYRDVVPNPIGPAQDSYFEVAESSIRADPVGQEMRDLIMQREALYDTAAPSQAPAAALADKLNQHDQYAQKENEAGIPSAQWTAYDQASVNNTVNVDQYRGKSKLRERYGDDMSHYDIAATGGTYDIAANHMQTYDRAGGR